MLNMRTDFRSKQESSRMNTLAPQRSPIGAKSAAINPNSMRETIEKVDKCMARLQELQLILSGETKIMFSPPRSKICMRTSVRPEQEYSKMKTEPPQRSPPSKFLQETNEEWQQMSLSALEMSKTLDEISKTSKLIFTSPTSTKQKCFCRRSIIERNSKNPPKILIRNEIMTLRDYLKRRI